MGFALELAYLVGGGDGVGVYERMLGFLEAI
jgi:hypothetical protein